MMINVLFNRQLAEIRSQEALEKEKTRRDYERLRMELDEVAKHEKEAKEKAGKVKPQQNIHLKHEQNFLFIYRILTTFRQDNLISKNKIARSS